jgi:hypothetical protein
LGFACSSEGFPDGSTVASPVRDEGASENGFDSLYRHEGRVRGMVSMVFTDRWRNHLKWNEFNELDESTERLANLFCSQGTRMRPSAFSLMGKSMSGSLSIPRVRVWWTVSSKIFHDRRTEERGRTYAGTSRS